MSTPSMCRLPRIPPLPTCSSARRCAHESGGGAHFGARSGGDRGQGTVGNQVVQDVVDQDFRLLDRPEVTPGRRRQLDGGDVREAILEVLVAPEEGRALPVYKENRSFYLRDGVKRERADDL